MKKLFIGALALTAFTACSQDEIVEQQSSAAIGFKQAFVENATRAATDPSITTEKIDAFDVWGFMDNTSGLVFNQQRVNASGSGENKTWSYSPLQYWLPGHTYYFGALAPVVDKNWTLDTSKADVNGIGTVTFKNVDGTEDLLYAAASESTADYTIGDEKDPVALTFNHLFSKVKFTFTNGFAAPNYTITVTNIKMVAPGEGSINLAQADWWTTNEWELEDGKTTTLDFGDMDTKKLQVSQTAECAQERLTIPADATQEYLVTFDVELFSGDVSAFKNSLSTTITGAALEIGKAYNFHATLDETNIAEEELKPIEFTVTAVKEWVDGNGHEGGVINTEVVGVKDMNDFTAAIEDGKTNFRLLNDITGSLTFGKTVDAKAATEIVEYTLDLNGKTISSTDDAITVESDVLTITGEGTVSAATGKKEPYCAVWAKGDAVVNIYGGTYKIGYPEGDYNDLIYAKENATINIYGGTFENSGRDNSFVLNVNDNNRETAAINVYGGSYENFDPANNLSEGANTNFVAKGYISQEKADKEGWYEVVVAPKEHSVKTAEELFLAVNAGGNITLAENITISSPVIVEAGKNIVLNLNEKKLTNKVDNQATDVIIVKEDASLTINGNNKGIVEAVTGNDGYAVIAEGVVTINGGTFKAGVDAKGAANAVIYARGNGKVYVNGGYFPNEHKSVYVLNKKDADKSTTTIECKGGHFYNYNPQSSASESPVENFCAEGYVATTQDDGSVKVVKNETAE